jgi:hypothetical protein
MLQSLQTPAATQVACCYTHQASLTPQPEHSKGAPHKALAVQLVTGRHTRPTARKQEKQLVAICGLQRAGGKALSAPTGA